MSAYLESNRIPGYWLGYPGALVPVEGRRGELTRTYPSSASTAEAASGRVRAVVGTRRRRRLSSVTVGDLYPDEVASILAVLDSTVGALLWVDAPAAHTNLLTPLMATCRWNVGFRSGGREPLDASGITYAAAYALPPTERVPFGEVIGYAPVIPGRPVTASVWAAGPDMPHLALDWLDDTEDRIGTVDGLDGPTTTAYLTRLAATGIPPKGAVAARMRLDRWTVCAQAALTWTDHANEWAAGGGVAQVLVGDVKETVTAVPAWQGATRLSSLSFTLEEVG